MSLKRSNRRANAAYLAPLLAGAIALALAPPAKAERRGGRDRDDDHERARHAVEKVELKPLAEILEALRGKIPGEVVGIEIEEEHGVWTYELKIVDPAGHLKKLHVEGATGRLIEQKNEPETKDDD